MTTTLDQVLGVQQLIGMFTDPRGGIPASMFPPSLFRSNESVLGDQGFYIRSKGTQTLARLVHGLDAASRNRGLKDTERVPVRLAVAKEDIVIPQSILQAIVRAEQLGDAGLRTWAQGEVSRQVREARSRFNNTRITMVASALGQGVVNYDDEGNITKAASTFQIDYQIDSGHTGQGTDRDGGTIIDASWATNTTNIETHMTCISQTQMSDYGAPLVHAFYGKNLLRYFLNNDKIKELINRSDAMRTQAAKGEVPQGLFGLQWWPAYQFFFKDDAGNIQTIFEDDDLVLTPEITPEWYDMIEGSTLVPTTGVGVVEPDMMTALRNTTNSRGMWTYAQIISGGEHPILGKQWFGDCMLPIIKAPKAIWQLDVTP